MRTKQKTTIKEKRFVTFSVSSHGKTICLKYEKQRLLDDYDDMKQIAKSVGMNCVSIKDMAKIKLFEHIQDFILEPEKYHLITYYNRT